MIDNNLLNISPINYDDLFNKIPNNGNIKYRFKDKGIREIDKKFFSKEFKHVDTKKKGRPKFFVGKKKQRKDFLLVSKNSCFICGSKEYIYHSICKACCYLLENGCKDHYNRKKIPKLSYGNWSETYFSKLGYYESIHYGLGLLQKYLHQLNYEEANKIISLSLCYFDDYPQFLVSVLLELEHTYAKLPSNPFCSIFFVDFFQNILTSIPKRYDIVNFFQILFF